VDGNLEWSVLAIVERFSAIATTPSSSRIHSTGDSKAGKGVISTITPYLAVESSRTKYDYGGISIVCFLP